MFVAFRGRSPFRQYILNKPAKYGLKLQTMVDAKTYYVCKIEVYARIQPDGPFKVDNSSCCSYKAYLEIMMKCYV